MEAMEGHPEYRQGRGGEEQARQEEMKELWRACILLWLGMWLVALGLTVMLGGVGRRGLKEGLRMHRRLSLCLCACILCGR